MAAVLVTLASAKRHLGITTSDHDLDIQLKLDQAEALILGYLDTRADPLWVSPATAPGEVTQAIQLWLTRLYEHRGDEDGEDAVTWNAITRILTRKQTPAIA